MKVLITGGTGLLGEALIATAGEQRRLTVAHVRNYQVRRAGVDYFLTDVRDFGKFADLFAEHHFDVVIHAAGIANVDYVERHFDEGWRSNVIGTQNIVDLARKENVRLVYISSNAVFDGKSAPYKEDDPTNPINKYGQIKVECEGIVRQQCPEALIVRPILMYGWQRPEARPNPVTWMIGRLQRGETSYLVTDVYENPLWSYQCAEAIWRAIELEKTGLFHIAGKNVVNRHELAMSVARVFGLDGSLIRPVESSFFPQIAPRPRNTSLLTERMERELKLEPVTVSEGLKRMQAMGESGRNV